MYWFFTCNRRTTLKKDMNNKANWGKGERVHENSLYFPLNYFVNLKLLNEESILIKKRCMNYILDSKMLVTYTGHYKNRGKSKPDKW